MALRCDGKLLAVACRGCVIVVNVETKEEIRFPTKPNTPAYGVTWSFDGELLAGSEFEAVHVWNMPARNERYTIKEMGSCKVGFLRTKHGPWLLVSSPIALGRPEAVVRVYDGRTGQKEERPDARLPATVFQAPGLDQRPPGSTMDQFDDFELAADNSNVVLASRSIVRVAPLPGMLTPITFRPTPDPRRVAVSGRGATNGVVATAERDGTVVLWHATTGRELTRLPGHSRQSCPVACSPDGQTVIAAGQDNELKVWSQTTITSSST
jgi:WD40 repeat protein